MILLPPSPVDPRDLERQLHSRQRRRMLTGEWRQDILERARKQFGGERIQAILGSPVLTFDKIVGDVDMSSNVFANVATELAVLYDEPFTPVHKDEAAAAVMDEILSESFVVPQLQTLQRMTLGLREMFVRVTVPDREGDGPPQLRLREMYPDLVVARPDPNEPGQASYVEEYVPRNGRWTIDVYDMTNPANPMFRTLGEHGEDITHEVHGVPSLSGETYPWRDDKEAPIMPIVAYHALVRSQLWDPFAWMEVVDGTLTCGVLFTYVGHIVRQASWPQRYTLNATTVGAGLTADGRTHIITDPTGVLQLRTADEATGQPVIGQWAPAADPSSIMDVVERYEARLAQHAGVAASDILRVSGDPRSGYALMLDQAARERAALRYEPAFQRSDRRLLTTIARMLNGTKGGDLLPTYGWRASYPIVERARARALQPAGVAGQEAA